MKDFNVMEAFREPLQQANTNNNNFHRFLGYATEILRDLRAYK